MGFNLSLQSRLGISRPYFVEIFTVSISVLILLSFLGGCAEEDADKKRGVDIIGDPLEETSSLVSNRENGQNRFWFYDELSGKVHGIDSDSMQYLATTSGLSGNENQSTVLYPDGVTWALEFTSQKMRILEKNLFTELEVSFQGVPISASWDAIERLLVVYDDLQSISMIRFSESGSITELLTKGALVSEPGNGVTIQGGDLDLESVLVTYSTEDQIIVSRLSTMFDNAENGNADWDAAVFDPGEYVEFSWLAALRDGTSRVMAETSQAILLIDYSSQTVVDTVTLADADEIEYRSRSGFPHLTVRTSDATKIVYADATGLVQVNSPANVSFDRVVASHLDTQAETITSLSYNLKEGIMPTNYKNERITGSIEAYSLRTARISDGLVTYAEDFTNTKAKFVLATDAVLAVYPSKLGFVERISASEGTRVGLRGFNSPWFKN